MLISNEVNKVYNIGTGEKYENIEIVNTISRILNKDVKFKFVEDRLGHDRRYSLNSKKYSEKFGKIQNVKLEEWLTNILKK